MLGTESQKHFAPRFVILRADYSACGAVVSIFARVTVFMSACLQSEGHLMHPSLNGLFSRREDV